MVDEEAAVRCDAEEDACVGKEIAVFRGHKDSVVSAAFSPDGTKVVTASRDKTARLWPLFPNAKLQDLVDRAKADVARCLTKDERRKVFLSEEAPGWCYEMSKWPYKPHR